MHVTAGVFGAGPAQCNLAVSMTEHEDRDDSSHIDAEKVAANGPVPKAVAGRLSLYLRELQHLEAQGRSTISSGELADMLSLTGAQVRKDLAYFGHFGQPGIGYKCEDLKTAIRGILGTDTSWPVVMIGVGNLGRALLGYKGFRKQGFHIASALDLDREKVGSVVEGVEIRHIDELPSIVQEHGVRLAMIAVPAAAAQPVADQLVEVGIQGVVNFAPVTLSLPEDVSLVGVDLAIELEQISFSVVNSNAKH